MSDSLETHRDYGAEALNESDLDPSPTAQLARWLAEAERAGIREPNAMVLSTVDAAGLPGSRTVLLRGLDARGLTFFTNYHSAKGRALAANAVASVLFPWYSLVRQAIVTGTVARLTAAESDAYFASRPRGSQIAAIASEQSAPIGSRAELEARVARVESEYEAEGSVERPEGWGGFRIVPTRVEFWKGRTSRLHDRFEYAPGEIGWQITRLQP
ncbi:MULTISPECIES: pyridoxamine 5'-phosphate oxidase [Subtercola]|uniref:Pyridoxine/pyridoxamine 5'-phosphate oxidase n=1 Tax=Subtercola vilae TaxID=2056433 RepID=A0A4T2BFM8_9MICO|nr:MULTISPECIES: pyridoxamine 5'-phosphate oxidase [Subtercola]MEA9985176.1 pyridoxamine 5'-phosphate oxidase [Subtercola sp. RTI3]TIH30105.1 pyridoxamine 5'-phosphate oxidase [Subtercola vilae]